MQLKLSNLNSSTYQKILDVPFRDTRSYIEKKRKKKDTAKITIVSNKATIIISNQKISSLRDPTSEKRKRSANQEPSLISNK